MSVSILNVFMVVLLASVWAVLLFYKARRKKLAYIKWKYVTDERAVPNMRLLLKRYRLTFWLSSDTEKRFYASLPDHVVLFRGGSMQETSSSFGISWSLRRDVAEHYAFRFTTNDRAVFMAIVPKSAIRAVLLPDSIEECLILSPSNVKVLTTQPTEFYYEHQKLRERLEQCVHSLSDSVCEMMRKNF